MKIENAVESRRALRLPRRERLAEFLECLRETVLRRALGLSGLTPRAWADYLAPDIESALETQARLDGVRIGLGDFYGEAEIFAQHLPPLLEALEQDARAALERDPAARSLAEVVLGYPGFEAVAAYRAAHVLWERGIPLLPRLLTETARSRTGIDIHPGAVIGSAFFIDHGAGTVIGETSAIGGHVTLYQGVTLGVLSLPQGASSSAWRGVKRHPTLNDHVTVYAQALILGGETEVGEFSVIGARARVTRSVPAYSKITGRERFQTEEEPCPMR